MYFWVSGSGGRGGVAPTVNVIREDLKGNLGKKIKSLGESEVGFEGGL